MGGLLDIGKLFFQKRIGLVSVCPKESQRLQGQQRPFGAQSKHRSTLKSDDVSSVMEGAPGYVVWHLGGDTMNGFKQHSLLNVSSSHSITLVWPLKNAMELAG